MLSSVPPLMTLNLTLNTLSIPLKPVPKSHKCFSISPTNQNLHGEEARWLREEQRWLREDQRWLRAESLWNAERHVLLHEIYSLKLKIQQLEFHSGGASVSESTNKLLKNVIAENGSCDMALVVDAAILEDEVSLKEIIIPDNNTETAEKRAILREGSGGDEVRTMQSMNSDISEVRPKVVPEEGVAEFLISQNRVFLLGENRWEDPSRLSASKQHIFKTAISGKATSKCVSCCGEGHFLCVECDGTGEPNIEPQFMEWFDDEVKCPYCKGLGYTTCNACGGVK